MNTPTNGGDSEPRSYAEARLRTCGRIISLAPDKLAALTNLACGFARDIRDGYLSQLAVADRLHELADAYGLIAEHGIDVVQRAIAQNMEAKAPRHRLGRHCPMRQSLHRTRWEVPSPRSMSASF
jgi:hypothetical protein